MTTSKLMQSIEVKNQNPVLVIAGVIQHPITKKILITKRTSGQHLAGLWEFPGGKVERDESLFHALQRELYEEIGLSIQAAHPLKQITHHYPDKAVCLEFWVITSFHGEAHAKENQQLEWVAIEQLSQYEFPEANNSILDSLNLTAFWMITPDCDYAQVDEFIDSTIKAIKRHKLKQILFRSKALNDEEYYLVLKQLKPYCDDLNCRLIINREVIDSAKSDHWHLTSTQLYQYQTKPKVKGVLSASCHTAEDLKQAELLQLNFVLLSAVNETKSHPDAIILGWRQFKALSQQTKLPVYALGGMKREDLTVAHYHGAIGIAGRSLFL